MRRSEEIQECKELLQGEPAHLHIRREAIVTRFTDDFKSALKQSEELTVVSVDVSNWGDAQFMETLRYELQEELSWLRGKLAKIWSGGLAGGAFGITIGGRVGTEAPPDYSRVNDYLEDVANDVDSQLVVFIDYHGPRPVDGFSWIPKLDIPDVATIVTDGYTACNLDASEEFQIGRLDIEQTVEYLTEKHDDIDREVASEIHGIHDGNPIAIEIAEKQGTLRDPLTGEALRTLWMRVYDDKISGEPLEFLTKSSHLNELDPRAITSVTDMNRGEVREVLRELKNKGVVSQEDAGLFTTDDCVKWYAATKVDDGELLERHRMTFRHYVRRWVEAYESRMREMESNVDDEDEDTVSPPRLRRRANRPESLLGQPTLGRDSRRGGQRNVHHRTQASGR